MELDFSRTPLLLVMQHLANEPLNWAFARVGDKVVAKTEDDWDSVVIQ